MKTASGIKKITRSTFKTFIKKNQGKLFVKQVSHFDGMYDCSMNIPNAKFDKAEDTLTSFENTLGIRGVWLVGSSRDNFYNYEDDYYQGFEVYNCVSNFMLVIKKDVTQPEPEVDTDEADFEPAKNLNKPFLTIVDSQPETKNMIEKQPAVLSVDFDNYETAEDIEYNDPFIIDSINEMLDDNVNQYQIIEVIAETFNLTQFQATAYLGVAKDKSADDDVDEFENQLTINLESEPDSVTPVVTPVVNPEDQIKRWINESLETVSIEDLSKLNPATLLSTDNKEKLTGWISDAVDEVILLGEEKGLSDVDVLNILSTGLGKRLTQPKKTKQPKQPQERVKSKLAQIRDRVATAKANNEDPLIVVDWIVTELGNSNALARSQVKQIWGDGLKFSKTHKPRDPAAIKKPRGKRVKVVMPESITEMKEYLCSEGVEILNSKQQKFFIRTSFGTLSLASGRIYHTNNDNMIEVITMSKLQDMVNIDKENRKADYINSANR